MPSKSKAQHNLMAMVAHDPKAAKRVGIPQSVGKEFMKANKGKMKKYAEGGDASSKKSRAMTEKEKEDYVDRVTFPIRSVGKNVGKRLNRIASAGLSTLGGVGLGAAGAIERLRDKKESDNYLRRSRNALRSAGRSAKAVFAGEPSDNIEDKYVDVAGDMIPGAEKINYRKGGSVKSSASRRADGIAQRGKTRGKFI